MTELGKKDEIFGAELLRELRAYNDYQVSNGRPTSFPRLQKDEKVIAGYDQGLGERMIVCDSLEEMQELYDLYARGSALRIKFYADPDPGFVIVIQGQGEKTK